MTQKKTFNQISQSNDTPSWANLVLDKSASDNKDINLLYADGNKKLWDLFYDHDKDRFAINSKTSGFKASFYPDGAVNLKGEQSRLEMGHLNSIPAFNGESGGFWVTDAGSAIGGEADVIVTSRDNSSNQKDAVLYDFSADSVSSERFKKDIQPLHHDPKKFLDVEAKTWVSDDHNETKTFGFIAEDLHEVFPEAVITRRAEKDSDWIDEEYLDKHGYDWGDDVPHQPRKMPLIAAHHELIQELYDRIEELEQNQTA